MPGITFLKKVLMTGGTGKLGKALRDEFLTHGHECVAPDHGGLDIEIVGMLYNTIEALRPNAVVNCAAILSLEAERDMDKAWRVNCLGVRNLAEVCTTMGVRLVQISTDYVFDGINGNYKEDDAPNPVNYYGVSKLGGEVAALVNSENLVLRAPFRYGPPWPYKNVFADQWTSGRWIHEVVPDIVDAALDFSLTGILHIGGPRRNLFNMASDISPRIAPCVRKDFHGMLIPRDTSLDSSKWNERRMKSTCLMNQK